MLLKGMKFGLILQLAIGPVCIYIFSLANNQGFSSAEFATLAVTIVDTLYVLFAILGVSSFIQNEKVKQIFKIIGSIVIICFGIDIISGTLDFEIIPPLKFFSAKSFDNSFINGFLLTASNPLTILFWTGIFSTKLATEKSSRSNVYLFGFGAVIATLLFLSVVAFLGSIAGMFIPNIAIKVLNIIVGIILIYFACTRISKKV